MTFNLHELCVPVDRSIREVVASIDRSGCGIALVTDQEGRLLDTITDGDVRRALLSNQDLGAPVSELLVGLSPVWNELRQLTGASM